MESLATQISGPVAVIGDVHGQATKLITVLQRIAQQPDFDNRWIVFIGDFVDRGPDPQSAIQIFFDLQKQHARTTAVSGNHEFAMAASMGLIPTAEYSTWTEDWLRHYMSESTFASYNALHGDLNELQEKMPVHHREFIAELPWVVEHPDYVFVHAGLDPNAPYEMQMRILHKKDFTLSRPQWLCSKTFVDSDVPFDCNKTVVSGHVPQREVVMRKQRILCDTTGGTSGDLSCVLLPEMQVITSGTAPLAHPTAAGKPSWWKIW